MTQLSARFGVAVRRLRHERRWSQSELAGRSDLDRSYVGEIERGEVMVSIATAEKIAVALELDLARLFILCVHSEGRATANVLRLRPIAR